jgi:Fe-S-cluster containining protein
MAGYPEVAAKIDAFFTRVEARHGGDMQCQTGCADCCHTTLSVTPVEAEAIRREIATWDAARRAALREVGPHPKDIGSPGSSLAHCAALDAAGRCKIYAARPFVCRSHGAPIRMRAGGLPVVQSCFRNFAQTAPDADCILDQTTLSALTLAVNGGATERIDLADLLASLC